MKHQRKTCMECLKTTKYWGQDNNGLIHCANCLEDDIVNYAVNIGDTLLCLKRQNYFLGQDASDCIPRGDLVTVDRIESDGRIGFNEHADRYGLWDRSAFRKIA